MQKPEKRNRRRITATLGITGAIAGATLTGAALTGASPPRAAESTQAKATEFPFTTLTRSQRMHLNVANVLLDSPDTTDAPDTNNPPDIKGQPCRVLYRLFDSEGRVVATATSTLAAGETTQLTQDAPDTRPGTTDSRGTTSEQDPPDATPARIQGLRGELLVQEGRCSEAILGSMEIIDTASGEVRAVIAPTKSLRVPQLDPPGVTPQ